MGVMGSMSEPKNVPKMCPDQPESEKETHTTKVWCKTQCNPPNELLNIDRDEETQKDGVEGERQTNTTAKSPAFWIFLEEF